MNLIKQETTINLDENLDETSKSGKITKKEISIFTFLK